MKKSCLDLLYNTKRGYIKFLNCIKRVYQNFVYVDLLNGIVNYVLEPSLYSENTNSLM